MSFGLQETRIETSYGIVIKQDMLSGTQYRIVWITKRGQTKSRYFASQRGATMFLKKQIKE